jgi:demethylmenaquinone methyltransferase / 2-methoxy-6-polyprenyl-1,4-benzoquinol methylase
MSTTVTPYNSTTAKKEQVAEMFDNIAHRYDFLNQLLSLGVHKGWRPTALKKLATVKHEYLLDVATGTGDFALEAMVLNPVHITGVDISTGMLEKGKEKVAARGLTDKITLQVGDSENLPFEANTFDGITVGFGVRNFENLEKGLSDMHRVLKPGGMAVILEFSRPRKFPVKQLYNFYFRYVCPLVGRTFSKDARAYKYLNESVNAFPDGNDFLDVLKRVGYTDVTCTPVSMGIASIYTGKK